jgi:hypothetical protein
MAAKQCNLCERPVMPKRNIGIGTFILVFCTGGFWLLAIPFYRKRCPICKGSAFTSVKDFKKVEKARENATA